MSAGPDSFVSSNGHTSAESHECHEGRECLESRKSPKSLGSHECPESREFRVSPVSEGQGLEIEAGAMVVLKRLAERNACTERNTARKRLWQLVRDVKALEKAIGREFTIDELMTVFEEWYRLSHPFLDPTKTRDDYLAKSFAQLAKVRVPTGEGDVLKQGA